MASNTEDWAKKVRENWEQTWPARNTITDEQAAKGSAKLADIKPGEWVQICGEPAYSDWTARRDEGVIEYRALADRYAKELAISMAENRYRWEQEWVHKINAMAPEEAAKACAEAQAVIDRDAKAVTGLDTISSENARVDAQPSWVDELAPRSIDQLSPKGIEAYENHIAKLGQQVRDLTNKLHEMELRVSDSWRKQCDAHKRAEMFRRRAEHYVRILNPAIGVIHDLFYGGDAFNVETMPDRCAEVLRLNGAVFYEDPKNDPNVRRAQQRVGSLDNSPTAPGGDYVEGQPAWHVGDCQNERHPRAPGGELPGPAAGPDRATPLFPAGFVEATKYPQLCGCCFNELWPDHRPVVAEFKSPTKTPYKPCPGCGAKAPLNLQNKYTVDTQDKYGVSYTVVVPLQRKKDTVK